MLQNKISYFQGTEKPKKYKPDKSIIEQPRFKEVFYKNYDTYDIGSNGPGSGWHNMHKYKSVSDFLNSKRKRMKNKYKDTINNRKKRHEKIQSRINFFYRIIKLAIDFPIDEQINLEPESVNSYSDTVPIGGQLDEYLTQSDFESKTPDQLNFGRDYIEDASNIITNNNNNNSLSASEPSLYGMPDGIEPQEDLDAPNSENPHYGILESGTDIYDKMWI